MSVEQTERQRIRVWFAKQDLARFVSHLDLMRAVERALRRSGLPLHMTSGFNPHPRYSFPAPLGVGMAGRREVMEFELNGRTALDEVARRLGAALPPGVELKAVEEAGPKPAQVAEMEYVARPRDAGAERSRVDEGRLREVLSRETIWVERERKGQRKKVDIRPFIEDMRVEGGAVVMRFRVMAGATTRPEEALGAAGFAEADAHALFEMERTDVVLAAPGAGARGGESREE
ncbi:MAG TPA: TIGR03936 family radical SAM-associated protein [Candidatus Brocadiia bacterium]|nr:TIGR03936 family radical SAM-associated protein [Candidatus Brocadiia bacterium]